MGKLYSEIPEKQIAFIRQQKLFFVGTAAPEGCINISPKGMDSLRVINNNRVVWLNVTGSGNETAAHVLESDRMTLMFVAFEGNPLILRLYGHANVVHRTDKAWDELLALFNPLPGTRQLFDVTIDLVQTSCGMSVPYFDYVEDRELLNRWAGKKGSEGIESYWKEKNQRSLDGKPTHIMRKNGIEQ